MVQRFFATVLLLGILFVVSFAHAQQNAPVSLSGHWEYLAFDLPNDSHSIFPDSDEAWSPVDHPKHKNPKCSTDVWFRVKLPEWQGDDPAIFIRVVKQNIEVYLDSTMIYSFGNFSSKEQITYSALNWHLFNLPDHFAGKTLTLHIRARHDFPGIMGDILIGSRSAIVGKMFRDNIGVVLIGLLFILSGILSALVFSLINEIKIYIGFVLLQIAVGVQTVAVSPIMQLIVSAPLSLHYIIYNATLFAALIGFVLLAANIVETKYRVVFKQFARVLTVLSIVVLIVNVVFHPFQRYISVPIYALMIVVASTFLYTSLKSYHKVGRHKQLFILGLNGYSLFVFIEILFYYFGIINSEGNLDSWFLHAGALCLFLFLLWIVVWRFFEMNKQTIVSLQHDRERIARDLHDEIGPRLTEIKIVGETIKLQTISSQSVHEKMDELIQAADHAVSSFGEIVWALTPTNNTVEELGSYLGQYASEFLAKFGVSCRLNLPSVFPDRKIDYIMSRNLVMAVKEILNNIVKHAGASLVLVTINIQGAHLLIEINDNGQGFDPGKVRPHGNGLKNIRHRIEKAGGRLKVESQSGHGTTIGINIVLG